MNNDKQDKMTPGPTEETKTGQSGAQSGNDKMQQKQGATPEPGAKDDRGQLENTAGTK